MLAGIGGRTIAEAKQRMSWAEFQAWCKYRAKHGPLSSQQRLEDVGAFLAQATFSTIPRPKGEKGPTLQQLRIYHPAKQADPTPSGKELSLQEAMAAWK